MTTTREIGICVTKALDKDLLVGGVLVSMTLMLLEFS